VRRPGLLALGVLAGALAVSGQEEGKGDALARELDRLKKLLAERIAMATPPPEQQMVRRTYDVADLCLEMRDRAQPPEDLAPSRYQPPEESDQEPWGALQVDALVEFLRIGVEPASWEQEGASIAVANNRLFVTAIPRVQGKIERLLAWFRDTMDRRLYVEVAAVPVRGEDARRLCSGVELTAEEAQRLLAQATGTVTLAGWDGHLAGGRVGREIAYVQDYDVKVAEGAVIGDPVTARLFAGCSAQVRACLDEGRGAILHCEIQRSAVEEPLPIHPTQHGDIELPTRGLTRLQTSFWAPLGQTVVAGGCAVGDEPCVILVTVRRR